MLKVPVSDGRTPKLNVCPKKKRNCPQTTGRNWPPKLTVGRRRPLGWVDGGGGGGGTRRGGSGRVNGGGGGGRGAGHL